MALYIIDSHGTRIYAGESMSAARIRLARMQARSPFAGYRVTMAPKCNGRCVDAHEMCDECWNG